MWGTDMTTTVTGGDGAARGLRRNMEDGGGEAGRSCISVSTDQV